MSDFLNLAGRVRLLGYLAVAAGLCAAAGSVGFAQAPAPKTMLALPPAPLLPQTLGSLTRVAEGDSGDGLGQLDAADAAVLTEDGLKRFARSEYTGGAQHGTVTVYKFGDASGAVSAFDYFRRPGQPHVSPKLADAVAADGQGTVLRSGVNVVREDFARGGDEVMQELIPKLPKTGGTAALAPLLPTLLPSKGLEAGSARYALGPAGYQAMGGVLPAQTVGFDKSAEVVTAKSNSKTGGSLTLLLYPTPQIAGDHGRLIEAEMKRQGAAAGTATLRREGPLLLLTTGAWKPAEAQATIDGIHLRSEVSFDKKMPLEFHAEVQKTYSLLTSIGIFCGVGALAALVIGLFFGGGRAALRVLQGKPAATEPEFLRIDLRGPSAKGSLPGPGA